MNLISLIQTLNNILKIMLLLIHRNINENANYSYNWYE